MSSISYLHIFGSKLRYQVQIRYIYFVSERLSMYKKPGLCFACLKNGGRLKFLINLNLKEFLSGSHFDNYQNKVEVFGNLIKAHM